MNYQSLKTKQRELRPDFSENLALRVHRALSWLDKAEQCEDDLDAQFIFLWIAFNAAYANEFDDTQRFSEQETFRNFIQRLCQLDKKEYLPNLVWHEFTGSIRVLLANKYVFKPFWDYHNQKISESDWQAQFKSANTKANKAIGNKDTTVVLSIVFSRLYMLRNQLLHGGATWNSGVNRDQIRDSVNFLSKFVPCVIDIMMSSNNANIIWGDACFPVIDK
ncbi:MAG: hypothetical protein JJV99_11780 [Colwellia sp.]|nr:hypothetical protein [Colwellia sp.]